jgi:hypothetical protein
MVNITKKEYEWGRTALNQNLISGIIFSILAIGAMGMYLTAGEINAVGAFMLAFFLLFAVLGLGQYSIIKKNRIFIKISDDGIHLAPIYMDFVFSSRFVRWEDISKTQIKTFGRARKVVLSPKADKDITIKLGYLNKDDQESLLQSLNSIIGKEASD